MKKKFNIYLITLKYTPKIGVLFCLCFLFMYPRPACAKHIALWRPDFKLLDESKYLYQEPDDVIDDVPGCGIYSEGDLDACFEEIVQHLSGKLNHVDAEVFAKAASEAGEKASLDILSKAKQSASLAYLHLRQINCDHLQRSSNGGRMHTLRGVWACQFWMDLHRRSLLRETDGEPPMRVKPRRNDPHGSYRLAAIWRRIGSGQYRLTRLQAQQRLSLARLARAKRRWVQVRISFSQLWEGFSTAGDMGGGIVTYDPRLAWQKYRPNAPRALNREAQRCRGGRSRGYLGRHQSNPWQHRRPSPGIQWNAPVPPQTSLKGAERHI